MYKAPFPQRAQCINFPSVPLTRLDFFFLSQWLAQLSRTHLSHPSSPRTHMHTHTHTHTRTTVKNGLGKPPPADLRHSHRSPHLNLSVFTSLRPSRHSHSRSTTIERRLIRLWKRMTGTVRRNERASILPDGFVLMNSAAARRRSMITSFAKS